MHAGEWIVLQWPPLFESYSFTGAHQLDQLPASRVPEFGRLRQLQLADQPPWLDGNQQWPGLLVLALNSPPWVGV